MLLRTLITRLRAWKSPPEGHPFYGNQWTGGGGGEDEGNTSSGKITGEVIIADGYRMPKLDQRAIDELNKVGKGDTWQAASDMGRTPDLEVFSRDNNRWTRGADSSAKEDIAAWLQTNNTLRTITLYDAWSSLRNNEDDFNTWLDTPIRLYRGGGMSDTFMSFTPSERVARDASKSDQIWTVSIPPRQWLGYSMGGNGEVYLETDAIEELQYYKS